MAWHSLFGGLMPSALRVASRFTAKADYATYVKRKKRDRENPLSRKEWEAKLHGGDKKEKATKGLSGNLSAALGKLGKGFTGLKNFVKDREYRGGVNAALRAQAKDIVRKLGQEGRETKTMVKTFASWRDASPGNRKEALDQLVDVFRLAAIAAAAPMPGSIGMGLLTKHAANKVLERMGSDKRWGWMPSAFRTGAERGPDDILKAVVSEVIKELGDPSEDVLLAAVNEMSKK
jgi:hypothetical protein